MIGRLGGMLPPELRDRPDIAAMLAEGGLQPTEMHTLSYRAGLDKAGPGKVFDFSRATLADHWRAGEETMRAVLQTLEPAKEGQGAGVSILGRSGV